jgi:hypothetical protein
MWSSALRGLRLKMREFIGSNCSKFEPMNSRTSKACSAIWRNSSAFARTNSGLSALADESEAIPATLRHD